MMNTLGEFVEGVLEHVVWRSTCAAAYERGGTALEAGTCG